MSNIELANQYFHQGNFNKAGQLYRQLLMENKQNISALWGLGNVALASDSYQRAYDIFDRCLSLNSNLPQLYLSSAQASIHLTLFDKAEQALLKAYQLNTTFIPTLFKLATYYCESGDYESSQRYIAQWRTIEPDNITAFGLLVRINKLSLNDNENTDYIASMQRKLCSSPNNLSKKEQVILNFSFAELYHNTQQYQQAFTHFDLANKLQREDIDFTVSDMQGYFSDLINVFDRNLFESTLLSAKDSFKKPTLTPIFIVGQPRSGSTLLEQMLIGHSKICSGGELPFLAGDIAQGAYQLTGAYFPEACRMLNKSHCEQLSAHYLKNLQSLAPSSNYIIDKMPANYQSIGLIKMLMPHAKIIHITRNPIDVSWSVFRNNFESLEPYFCSLPEIAQYHQLYQTVMNHWHTLIPTFIHTVAYEDLILAPEQEIKNILAFCQLDLEDNCFNVPSEKRYIRTLSDTQLRAGINQNRERNWLPYKEFLEPLFDALEREGLGKIDE
ncbi:MAG: sulfotransferase [Colwellia sp.]|nr:sulfotransferase [Colwellia sp.]